MFSVVIPLYNKAAEIERTVLSVLAQTFPGFEIVIVDDGSTDSSADVVRTLTDPRVRLITQTNAGVAAARNRGIDEATNDWIAFLDADDTWLPDHLSHLDEIRSKNPTAEFLATAYWANRGPRMRRRISSSMLAPRPTSFTDIGDSQLVPTGTAMTKRSLQAVGGYREIIGEDVDLWFRVGVLYPLAYSRRATAVWHLDAGNRRTHKTEAASAVELYIPGGLMWSLNYIVEHTADPAAAIRATEYVAARERKAILVTLRAGNRPHAQTLYDWWKKAFSRRDRLIELNLMAPAWLQHGYAFCKESVRLARALLGYSANRLRFS
jgi:glycosyltransferase involved in cell wall biosynthesis